MKKKKILQVSVGGLGNGGTQNIIMGIVRNLSSDFEFDILLFTNDIRYYDDEFLKYGEIFRIPTSDKKNKIMRKILQIIKPFRILIGTYKILKRSGDYHAIHCHNELESGICTLAAYFAGVKIRISHSHTNRDHFIRNNYIKYIYNKTLQLLTNKTSNIKIGCTEESFNSIFGNEYLSKKTSKVIYNSIDLEKFKKNNCGNNLKKINIVNVGSFSENKNQMFLIEMLPLMIKKIPNIKLKLVGFKDDYKQLLQKRVNSLGLNSEVDFLPPDSDIPSILEDADLFIFPSLREGFGIALLEAQAMEVPCLVSDSVPKVVDVGLSEFLPLSKGKEVWAEKAVNIIEGNHKLKLNKKKLNKFSLRGYLNQIKEIYSSS
ncbi:MULTISPECIES: glycosyltransferase [unclassified Oceanobacillus]|uniref:glycosyltransferase n=1 Tax=unclassified Oceanobacillus TaxID=2630292 RepID=UPI00300E2E7A